MYSFHISNRSYQYLNWVFLGLAIWVAIYFCSSCFFPFMKAFRCPYLAATGRKCILCGYTTMTYNFLKDGTPINLPLAFFLVCYVIQLVFRVCLFVLQLRKVIFSQSFIWIDLATSVGSGLLGVLLFWLYYHP